MIMSIDRTLFQSKWNCFFFLYFVVFDLCVFLKIKWNEKKNKQIYLKEEKKIQ